MGIDYERWRNVSPGIVWVKKIDRKGDLADEVVRPGQVVSLTTNDRMLNQEMAAEADLDVFKNGRLAPVKILDGTEDAAEIASNPNLISEGDMQDLFKLHHKTFEKRISEITNTVVVQRLHDLAAERGDVKLSHMRAIEARLEELSPAVVERKSVPITAPGSYA